MFFFGMTLASMQFAAAFYDKMLSVPAAAVAAVGPAQIIVITDERRARWRRKILRRQRHGVKPWAR